MGHMAPRSLELGGKVERELGGVCEVRSVLIKRILATLLNFSVTPNVRILPK